MTHHNPVDWIGLGALIASLTSIALVYWGIIKEKHFSWRRDVYQGVYEYLANTERIFRSYVTEQPSVILDKIERLGLEKLNAEASILASPKIVPLIDAWLISRDSCYGALLQIEISTDLDDRPELWKNYKSELKLLSTKGDAILFRIRQLLLAY